MDIPSLGPKKVQMLWRELGVTDRISLEKVLKNSDEKINDNVLYTLVLRIRTLHIIQKLIEDQVYSKKALVKLIIGVSGSGSAYESYLRIKNNEKEKYLTTKEEAEKLLSYLKKQLSDIKKLLII